MLENKSQETSSTDRQTGEHEMISKSVSVSLLSNGLMKAVFTNDVSQSPEDVTLVVTHSKQLRRHQQIKLFGQVNGATNQNKQTLASSSSNSLAINSCFFIIK